MSFYEKKSLAIPGCFLIYGKRPVDDRGWFYKPYFAEGLSEIGISFHPTESYFSASSLGVIRGMHFQMPPYAHQKMVFCLKGKVLDVGLDLRKQSPTFGQCFTYELSAQSGESVFFAEGVAHGFAALEEDSVLGYFVDKSYSAVHDSGVRYDSFKLDWPFEKPILSARDRGFKTLEEFTSPF